MLMRQGNYSYLDIGGVGLKTFFSVVILISSVFLIVSILLQPSNSEGLGTTISGAGENIWGRNKSRSFEATLQRLTTISAIVFIISALVLAAMQ